MMHLIIKLIKIENENQLSFRFFFEDDGIKEIASRYAKSPAQLLLRWNIQQGIIPIPKTKHSSRLIENISVFDFQIEPEDMAKLNAMNENIRTMLIFCCFLLMEAVKAANI